MIKWCEVNMEPGCAPEFPLDFNPKGNKEATLSINNKFEVIELQTEEDCYVYIPTIDGSGKREDIDKAKKILEDEAKRRGYKNLDREDRCICLYYDDEYYYFGLAILAR
jgi:hypothetical protein